EQQQKIKTAIENAPFVCTTADIWSATNRRFMGVTAHWITEDLLERKSAAIACRTSPGNHTWDNVAELLLQINKSFGLVGEKLISTVTDNGSNFVKAFKQLGVTLYRDKNEDHNCIDSDLDEDNDIIIGLTNSTDGCSLLEENLVELPQHIRCASYTLHLVATNTTITVLNDNNKFKIIYDETISRCETLWKSMRSPKNAAITAVMHPKFKNRWLVCLLSKLQERVREKVLEALHQFSNATPQQSHSLTRKKEDYFDFGSQEVPQMSNTLSCQGNYEIELLMYLQTSDCSLDILKSYPTIRKAFIKYNTTLPSSAPVERLFSFATKMNMPKYNRLSDTLFETRVLAVANAKKTC
ncbi:hypothetical protein X777_04808, partial [Ooceraea biroi]